MKRKSRNPIFSPQLNGKWSVGAGQGCGRLGSLSRSAISTSRLHGGTPARKNTSTVPASRTKGINSSLSSLFLSSVLPLSSGDDGTRQSQPEKVTPPSRDSGSEGPRSLPSPPSTAR